MEFVLFMSYCLAVWRISYMLVHEEGPYDIFGKLRDLSGISYDVYSDLITPNVVSKILVCVQCTSVWVAALLFLLYLININIFTGVVAVFGASAIATILNQRL
jgi:hypothetical protein